MHPGKEPTEDMQDIPAPGEIDWQLSVMDLTASPNPEPAIPARLSPINQIPFPSKNPDRTNSQFLHNRVLRQASPYAPDTSYMSTTGLQNWVPQENHFPPNFSTFGSRNPAYDQATYHTALMTPVEAIAKARQGVPSSPRVLELIAGGYYDLPGDRGSSCDLPPTKHFSRPGPRAYDSHLAEHSSSHQSLSSLSTAVEDNTELPDPAWLEKAVKSRRPPSFDVLAASMPFVDATIGREPSKNGVVRVLNPPHHVTRAEVLAALGRNSKVVRQPENSPYFAVHILMERDTGKTQDIFVEVASVDEARTIAAQFAQRNAGPNRITLGNRQANIVFSSQKQMMQAIFPRARKVYWEGATASVDFEPEYFYPGQLSVGFDGFLGDEETALLCKWLQEPSRSPFLGKTPVRPYECAITLMHKYPIDNADHLKMGDRYRLYTIAQTAIEELAKSLRTEEAHMSLDARLLQELVIAALGQPVFADQQKAVMFNILKKYEFLELATNPGMMVNLPAMHPLSAAWPFVALQRKQNVSEKFLRYYTNIIREHGQVTADNDMTAAERAAASQAARLNCYEQPFVRTRLDYRTKDFASLYWKHCLEYETRYIHAALKAHIMHVGGIISAG